MLSKKPKKDYPQPEYAPLKKEWGTDELVFFNEIVKVHRIEIKSGGKSTDGNFHKHRYSFNKFYIENGMLDIYVKSSKEDYFFQIGDDCEFRSVTIFPNNLHRFEAITNCIAYEIYWVQCQLNDILRYDKDGNFIPFKQE